MSDLDSRRSPNNIFVTGRPGVGKTTLILSLLDELDVTAGGFFTREIREGGKRVGFSITALNGGSGVLARVGLESPYRVGRYGVNRPDLERVGIPAVEDAIKGSELIVMDEIGRMELCSPPFRDAVMRALDSAKPVFGTIQDRRNVFLDEVRARPDVSVLRLKADNRDAARESLLRTLRHALASPGPDGGR